MASRLILNEIKAPIHFLLRSPASSRATAPLAQTIQNLLVPIPRKSESSVDLSVIDRSLLSRDFRFRVELRDKRQPVVEDDDELSDSESDFEDFDGGICSDDGEEFGGDDYDNDDAEPRD